MNRVRPVAVRLLGNYENELLIEVTKDKQKILNLVKESSNVSLLNISWFAVLSLLLKNRVYDTSEEI